MPTFDGVRGSVHYRVWEAPDARAGIVFLHGYGEHSGLYHRFGAALNQRGITLWALDEIGHGLSEGARGVVESLDDLELNARRLTQIATAAHPELGLVLAGHSLGGATAALMAARAPEPFHGVVLSGAPLGPPPWFAQAGDGLSLEAADLSGDPFYLDELASDPLAFTESEGSPLQALPAAWKELSARFADVRVPVLLVHGTEDPVAPVQISRDWADRVPAVRLAEIEGARHDVLNETVHARVAAEIAQLALWSVAVASPQRA